MTSNQYYYYVIHQIRPVGTLSRRFLYSLDIVPSFFKHFFTFRHNKMLQTCLILSQPQSQESVFSPKSLVPFSGNDIQKPGSGCQVCSWLI